MFDNLAYRVDGNTVTLMGEVTRPTLKSDADNVVKDVEGVERVDNQIKVLPLSPQDDESVWRRTAPFTAHPASTAMLFRPCRRSTSSWITAR